MADYKVTVDGREPIMVRAANQAQARNFAVRNQVKVELLTMDDAIAMAKDGKELHDASGEDGGEPTPETTQVESTSGGIVNKDDGVQSVAANTAQEAKSTAKK